VLAVVQFVGSVGGSWLVDDAAVAGFQQRRNCGPQGDEGCFVNVQAIGTQNLFTGNLAVSYTGNLPGCPSTPRTDGSISGKRVVLPGCFSGSYVTINEVVSDSGADRAFFDSSVPDLTVGVWVEVQGGNRRFKFTSNGTGCELTTATKVPVNLTLSPASLPQAILETTISAFIIGTEVYTGGFDGLSSLRLTSSSGTLWLERRDESGTC
jgi:hypothetical protein